MEKTQKAVAVLSGGLDSSLALAQAKASGVEILSSVTFNYGQRAYKAELKAARAVSEHFGVAHQSLDLPWIQEFQSALTNTHESLPLPTASQLDESNFSQSSAKAVWVPNRNGVLIEVAAGIAENLGANRLIVGFNAEEATTFADNSQAYIEALNHALSFSTSNQVKVICPTVEFNKTQIVRQGLEINFPFELLWSCYESSDKMCGQCESCMRSKRAYNNNQMDTHAYFKN